MKVIWTNGFILAGLLFALLGAVRAAPDLSQAITGLWGQESATDFEARQVSGPGGEGDRYDDLPETRPALKPAVEYEEGVSAGFIAGDALQGEKTQSERVFTSLEEIPDFYGLDAELEWIASRTSPQRPQKPARLVIPSIQLDAPIKTAQTQVVEVQGREYLQWLAPEEFAAGWHDSSALLGSPGNTVLNGHHNISGMVFGRLVDVQEGDLIRVYSADRAYEYLITNKMILPEKYEQLDVRMENARWILPSQDERLTLITCWPAESNTHRLIVVAKRLS